MNFLLVSFVQIVTEKLYILKEIIKMVKICFDCRKIYDSTYIFCPFCSKKLKDLTEKEFRKICGCKT